MKYITQVGEEGGGGRRKEGQRIANFRFHAKRQKT